MVKTFAYETDSHSVSYNNNSKQYAELVNSRNKSLWNILKFDTLGTTYFLFK